MTDNSTSASVVSPSEGVTPAERYLAKLCKRSFLSIWSYPAVFRDQGRVNGKGDGKEVCDLLVVFENHILIFSDKDCGFDDTGNLDLDWSRWYRKAVLKSADQVFGAERWIRKFPNKLFLDRQCRVPFPITLPTQDVATFHRIVVAHSGSRRCKEVLGGSGSMMLHNAPNTEVLDGRPFAIGQVNPAKGYVHVFDDTTLDVVMKTLDTITDFTSYLTKKELFLTGSKKVLAAGEEELLALYLGHLNAAGEHDFVFKGGYNAFNIGEGLWDNFKTSSERRAQVEADQPSYAWDSLLESFAFHAMTGTQYFSSGEPLREQEKMFRIMAREPRTRRRILAISLREVLERSAKSSGLWDARVMAPDREGYPYYVFLCVKRPKNVSDEEYRDKRIRLLSDDCHVVKLSWPDATQILGIATESVSEVRRSEDMLYLDVSNWGAEAEQSAQEIQQRLGILKQTRTSRSREYEYPVDHLGLSRNRTPPSRNSPCECRSGKRFRYCCGRKLFPKKPKSKLKD
jgi:hypothetical protein